MDENQRNEKGQRTMYKDPQEYDQFVDLYRMLQEAFITSSTTLNQHKTENPQTPPKPPKQETKVEKPITSKIKQTQIEEQMNQKISTGKSLMIMGFFLMMFAPALWFVVMGMMVYGYTMFKQGKDTQVVLNRFKQYARLLKRKNPATIKELAREANVSETYVLSDLEQMINKGLFVEGHLDRANNLMYVTDEAYDSGVGIENFEDDIKEAIAEGVEPQEDIFDEAAAPEKVRDSVVKAEKYIQKIQRRQKQINSTFVKGQLDEMEQTLREIIEYIIAHPNTADGIDKLMKYYLPTSIKLLDTYRDLESQSIQGGNIAKSKKDIEDVLVTLNQGYKILLDDLFKDTSMDVTSDISVLESLLAQEGLTNEGITEKEKVE